MRFGPVPAAVGRFLEGHGVRAVYGERPIAAVSPSTRQELRRRLRFRGPIHIVPNGNSATPAVRSPRDPEPTITIVARLVPHKRVDVLLAQLAVTVAAVPDLRVDIVGDGPERIRLTTLAAELGLSDMVTFHGFQPDAVRDELLRRAWLTMSTSSHEGWGLSIVEAAAHGVPTIALRAPGVRDSVVSGSTGWLVDEVGQFGAAAAMALRALADEDRARPRARRRAAARSRARHQGPDLLRLGGAAGARGLLAPHPAVADRAPRAGRRPRALPGLPRRRRVRRPAARPADREVRRRAPPGRARPGDRFQRQPRTEPLLPARGDDHPLRDELRAARPRPVRGYRRRVRDRARPPLRRADRGRHRRPRHLLRRRRCRGRAVRLLRRHHLGARAGRAVGRADRAPPVVGPPGRGRRADVHRPHRRAGGLGPHHRRRLPAARPCLPGHAAGGRARRRHRRHAGVRPAPARSAGACGRR